MDKLVKTRASVRRLITIAFNDLEDDLIAKDVVNLRTKANKFAAYVEQITPLDRCIVELMIQDENVAEETYQDEVVGIDAYAERIFKAQVKIQMVLEQSVPHRRGDGSMDDDFQSIASGRQIPISFAIRGRRKLCTRLNKSGSSHRSELSEGRSSINWKIRK